jgi:uncharacterized membrane protein
MAAPKGHPRYGGRAKGTPNKRTRELLDATRAAREKARRVLGKDAFDGDAHALLVLVYRDTSLPIELRLDAAKVAINYESPRLQAIQVEGHTEIEVNIPPEEQRAIAQELFERAFGMIGKSRPQAQIIEAEAIQAPK